MFCELFTQQPFDLSVGEIRTAVNYAKHRSFSFLLPFFPLFSLVLPVGMNVFLPLASFWWFNENEDAAAADVADGDGAAH